MFHPGMNAFQCDSCGATRTFVPGQLRRTWFTMSDQGWRSGPGQMHGCADCEKGAPGEVITPSPAKPQP